MVKGHIGAPFGEDSVSWTLEQIPIGETRRNSPTSPVASSESSLAPSMDDGEENKTEEEEEDQVVGARALSLDNGFPPLPIYNISQDNVYPPLPIYNANISPAEMAMQDSENNNVDENSNDQQYSEYTEYHQQYSNHQFVPDQSVRPRIPRQRQISERGVVGDEPDLGYPSHEGEIRTNRRRTNSFRLHRRTSSEDMTVSSSNNNYYDGNDGYVYPHMQNTSDRLAPLPNHNQGRGGDSRHSVLHSPRSWIPRYVPSPEETQNEARDLMVNFTIEELRNNSLAVPDALRRMQRHGCPGWARAGMELRQLADTFAETEERRRVRLMAERVNMSSINMDNFFQLCTELFSDGITRERIVALFTFIADVAIHHVRAGGNQFIQCLMDWSLQYMWHRICNWVQEAGGWSKVLSRGMSIIYRGAVIAFCFVGTIAAGVFIAKTLKEM